LDLFLRSTFCDLFRTAKVVIIIAVVCPICRAEIPDSELAAAVSTGKDLECEKCGTILTTDGLKRDIDKALDDFTESFPKKFDVNIKF
jgi:hypothetical protein